MNHRSGSVVKSYSKLFIGNQWASPSSDSVLEVVSPINEKVIATTPAAQPDDVNVAVAAARKAFDEGPWPRLRASERAEMIKRVGNEVERRLEDLKIAFTEEIGATQAIANAFLSFAVGAWHDAASMHDRFALEEQRKWMNGCGTIIREPVGVVAAILPWNGPVTMSSIKMAYALAAGCTVVLKPAPEGPVGTLLLAEAIDAAGFPDGVVSIIPGGRETGEYLVGHPGVDKVTFTGSTAAGRRIMAICAERVARVTLELGGKSAAIIADDIPIEKFISQLAFAGIGNSGQVCAALTRIIVPRHREKEIVDGLVSVFENVKIGDPRDPETEIGPLVTERQRDRVENYIQIGKGEGATVVTGGRRPNGLQYGWYIEPTLFTGVSNDMRIAQEEIFGPVVCVMPFDQLDEAVKIANDSVYGLSGAVYARDEQLAEKVARKIRTGQIAINNWDMCVVEPFGGFKQSGLGREGGVEGMSSFVETKLIINSGKDCD